jgi:CRISPR-associated protein Cas2
MGKSRLIDASPIKNMWMFAIFDLPVLTKTDRKHYTRFRQLLLAEGFLRLQFSVYARCCQTRENTATILRRVGHNLPPRGEVRFLAVTDKQFADMTIYNGRTHGTPEEKPKQMLLF